MTCRFCAWCLDEAVEVRARLMRKNAGDKAKQKADFDEMHQQTVKQPEWGGI